MKISLQQVLALPLGEYYDSERKILHLSDDQWPKTPVQIAGIERISLRCRLDILLQPNLIARSTLWLLACDFAGRVLPLFEKHYPGDVRPRVLLQTSRKYYSGKASIHEVIRARDIEWASSRIFDLATRRTTRVGIAMKAIPAMAARDAIRSISPIQDHFTVAASARAAGRIASFAVESQSETRDTWQKTNLTEDAWQLDQIVQVLERETNDIPRNTI